jgi:GntR family transcriptional repressor for pyruvate dehydrogenase complex
MDCSKPHPQSGTYVAGYGIKILDSMITDIIRINKNDFGALIEARYYMELNSAKLAAERRSDKDISRDQLGHQRLQRKN